MILLTGPVSVEPEVALAFAEPPVSHRCPEFLARFERAKHGLRALTGAPQVSILPGSGTLANDAVAAQLALVEGRGLVLSNGEFGERLIDHAMRHRLSFDSLRFEWGTAFSTRALGGAVARRPAWIWAVHCETSTGMVNDLWQLAQAAEQSGALLAVDAMSSLGAIEVDLRRVDWATSASGKALRSYPGLAIVFHRRPAAGPAAARALDLAAWRDGAVGTTISSNLVAALAVAVERLDSGSRFARLRAAAADLRARLLATGLEPLLAAEQVSPAVLTCRLPPGFSAVRLGGILRDEAIWVSFESGYLMERNWIQFCTFGEPLAAELAELPSRIAAALPHCRG